MNIKKASILLVDDEPVLREILEMWLARVAARAYSAEDGAEALKVLAANHIDLIISDVRMPVMDGITLLKKVNAAGAPMPHVILITGFSDISSRDAHHLGAEAILEKPITRETLLQAAQRSLAGPDDLWRELPSGSVPQEALQMNFPSLDVALEQKRIGLGRGGFCVQTQRDLYPGWLEFKLNFEADQRSLSGQGIVRWTEPQEHLAGVEITCLDDASRMWLLEFLEQKKPLPFIPRLPGR